MGNAFIKIFVVLLIIITTIIAKQDQDSILVQSRLTLRNGFLHTNDQAALNQSSQNIFFYNINNFSGGTTKVMSDIYLSQGGGKNPERIFISNVVVKEEGGKNLAKVSYSIYKLNVMQNKDYYDIRHGLLEFEIEYDVKYHIPITELGERQYEIYFSKIENKKIKFDALFQEKISTYNLNAVNNIKLEYLQTNDDITEIFNLHSLFPIRKSRKFHNNITDKEISLKSDILFGSLSLPFELYDEDEIEKIPNYNRIKKNFISDIKIFVVPVSFSEQESEFDIYINYSRFRDLYYCEWDLIKKRIKLRYDEKVKLELPREDWKMRASNPFTNLNIDWYQAYFKHVKEFIIISYN